MWSYAKNDWQRSYLNSTILFVCLLYIYRIDSVTRFGEISPFVQYFRTLWQNFKCLIWIWQNFWPSLAFKICYWAIFLCYKIAKFWTSDLAIWSHTGCREETLACESPPPKKRTFTTQPILNRIKADLDWTKGIRNWLQIAKLYLHSGKIVSNQKNKPLPLS